MSRDEPMNSSDQQVSQQPGNVSASNEHGTDLHGSNMMEHSYTALGSYIEYNKKRGFIDVENVFRKPMFPQQQMSSHSASMINRDGVGSSMISNSEQQMTRVVWGTNINTSDFKH